MILGNNLPNIPWQDRPAGCTDIIWRYDNNPIVGRHDIPSANSIFNSAVIPKDGAFVVVFRSDNKAMEQQLRQKALQSAGNFMQELFINANVKDNRYMFF